MLAHHQDAGNLILHCLLAGSFTSTLIGSGGYGSNDGPALLAATLMYPYGIAILPGSALGGMSGVIWADMQGCKVRHWDATTNLVSTISGSTCGYADGAFASAQFGQLQGLVWHPLGEAPQVSLI